MDAAAELGRNSASTRFSLSMEMSRLTRDGTAEPVSRDQILRRERRQRNIDFPCLADHEQEWQPYPVDPYSAICDDHTYIHSFWHLLFIYLCIYSFIYFPYICRFCLVYEVVLMFSSELRRCCSDIFLSGRPRTGLLAIAHITVYG